MSSKNKTATIHVSKPIQDWIIEEAKKSGFNEKAIETISQWMIEGKEPTYNQVVKIGKKLHIPFGYFLLNNPPSQTRPIVEYRTVKSGGCDQPSRDLIEVIDDMSSIQEWLIDDAIHNGITKLNFVGSFSSSDDTGMIAGNIRATLQLDADWTIKSKANREAFKCLRSKLSDVGVTTIINGIVGNNTKRKLAVDEFRAFVLVDKIAPLIFINGSDTDNGRLFSLAHEAAHIWLGVDDLYNDSSYAVTTNVNNVEVMCNAIAAELLVPKSLFEREAGGKLDIGRMADTFHCSEHVIAKRAMDLGYISAESYRKYIKKLEMHYLASREKAKHSGGGNYYNNLAYRFDQRFILSLKQSLSDGRTAYTEAYGLTNTNGRTFDKLIKMMAG